VDAIAYFESRLLEGGGEMVYIGVEEELRKV
jgi:hypothetical protein